MAIILCWVWGVQSGLVRLAEGPDRLSSCVVDAYMKTYPSTSSVRSTVSTVHRIACRMI